MYLQATNARVSANVVMKSTGASTAWNHPLLGAPGLHLLHHGEPGGQVPGLGAHAWWRITVGTFWSTVHCCHCVMICAHRGNVCEKLWLSDNMTRLAGGSCQYAAQRVRVATKIFEGFDSLTLKERQSPLSKRYLSSDARFIALPS